jgi:hypothetical protein
MRAAAGDGGAGGASRCPCELKALRALRPLCRLGSFDHRKLNLIGKAGQMQGQPIEHFPLGRDSGKIAD